MFQVTHGGLFSEDSVMLDDIRNLRRDRQPPEEGIMCELLWSDPHDMVCAVHPFSLPPSHPVVNPF